MVNGLWEDTLDTLLEVVYEKKLVIIFQTSTVYLSSCVQNYGTLCTARDSLPLGRVSTGDALP